MAVSRFPSFFSSAAGTPATYAGAYAHRWAFLCSKRIHILLLNNIIFRRLIVSRIKSAHSSKDQVHLTKIIEQNIHTIINTRRVTANQRTTEERLAGTVTNF
jgi:hypothetical protein